MKLTVKDKYFIRNNKLFLFSCVLFSISSVLSIISMFLIKSINIYSLIYIISLIFLCPSIILDFENTNIYYEREGIQKIPYYIICLYILVLSLFIITGFKFCTQEY